MSDLSPPDYLNDAPPITGEVMASSRNALQKADNPFGNREPEHISAGTVAVESRRAAAEVQGRMIVAKQWPRDSASAYARAMDSCRRLGLAEAALYLYNRGGEKIEGPSIRLAEELARCWGNIEFGLRELSRRDGESEMEAFAWDVETNVRSSQNFTVRHVRDRRAGAKALTEERDIYEVTANSGSRRLRARILAILPPELVDDAVSTCRATIKNGGGKSLSERIRLMTTAFSAFDVTADMLVGRLGHSIAQITPDELAELRGILQSLKENASTSKDWFGHAGQAHAALPKDADPFESAAAGRSEPSSTAQTRTQDNLDAPEKAGDPPPVKNDPNASAAALQPAALSPGDDAAGSSEPASAGEMQTGVASDLMSRLNGLKTVSDLNTFVKHEKTKEALAKFSSNARLTGEWLRALDARRKVLEGGQLV